MERVFMKGCEAIAEAAVRAGCRFFAGYPITPQNEIPEYFSRRMPEVNGVFVQGESEVASVNMVYGASATGTRSMTSSSSCGISLKSEGISYMAGASLPTVLVSVMRGGPGVGSIQPSQQDYFQATKASGNGGFRMIVLAPASMQEAIDMTYDAFDYAEKYKNPAMVLIDGFTAAMMEPVTLPPMKTDEELAKMKKASGDEWAAVGREGGRGKHSISSGRWVGQEGKNIEDAEKYELIKQNEIKVEEYLVDDAEVVIAAYGIAARISKSAIDVLRNSGYKVGMIRPITLFPFPEENFKKLDYGKVKGILNVEMSIPAQMVEDVQRCVMERAPIDTCLRSGGEILSRDTIVAAAKKLCESEGGAK